MGNGINPWVTTARPCRLCGSYFEESTSNVYPVTNCRCPSLDCDNHRIRPSSYYDEHEDED